MFTAVLCVLRARSSRSEVRGDTDRMYNTIKERELTIRAFGRSVTTNSVYDTIQEREMINTVCCDMGEDTDAVYEKIQDFEFEKDVAYIHAGKEGMGSSEEMVKNAAYGHVGKGGGGAVGGGDRADEEMENAYGLVAIGECCDTVFCV